MSISIMSAVGRLIRCRIQRNWFCSVLPITRTIRGCAGHPLKTSRRDAASTRALSVKSLIGLLNMVMCNAKSAFRHQRSIQYPAWPLNVLTKNGAAILQYPARPSPVSGVAVPNRHRTIKEPASSKSAAKVEPEETSDEILLSRWQDLAEERRIPNDQIFRSWRRFKEVSAFPYRLENSACMAGP